MVNGVGGIGGGYNITPWAGFGLAAPGFAGTTERVDPLENGSSPETTVKPGRKSSPAECQSCKTRKYQDGSDENDVSFKSPTHISPSSAGGAVRAHEGMHVANAYQKAAEGGGKVLRATVSIHTAVCQECGRVYVSGGTTSTAISYPKDNGQDDKKGDQAAFAVKPGANVKNPYSKQAKAIGDMFSGSNVNYRL